MKVTFVRCAFISLATLFLSTVRVASGRAQTSFQLSFGTSTGDLTATGTGGQTIDTNGQTCTAGTCIFATDVGSPTNPFTSVDYVMTSPGQTAFTLTAGAPSGSFTVSQAALTPTGGYSAAALPSGGANLNVQIVPYNSFFTLPDGTTTATTQVESASVSPEPASIFLFGSGLLALGFLLRSRRPV